MRDLVAFTSILGSVLVGLWLFSSLSGFEAVSAFLSGLVLIGLYFALNRSQLKVPIPQGSVPSGPAKMAGSMAPARAVLKALNQPALIVQETTVRVYNQSARRLFNLPDKQTDVSIASLRHPTLLDAIEHVLEQGGQAQCEVQPARNLGEYWLVEVTALGDETDKRSVLVVMTDQKPIRLAQKARADFLANASHELRTPLTSISGFIETMKGPAKDDYSVWPRFIDIMDDQTRHMRELISDLLSLSRIELSQHLLPETHLDLCQAAEDALEALQPIGAAQNLTFACERPDRSLMILGDEGEVKQVIRNLVGNAIKYAPDGSVIQITLGQSPSLLEAQSKAAREWSGASRMTLLNPQNVPGSAVWLRVRDYGVGISSEHLPRLGERFYRVDDSRGGPIEGTGLGLAIVKHIMARHRGGLAVESLHGEGSVFSVWFVAAES